MTRLAPFDPLGVDLQGYGKVGRALLRRLPQPGIRLASVSDSTGVRIRRPPRKLRNVFVDATSPRYEGTEADAWVGRLEEVLEKGTPVVTCNKAPLALSWSSLERAARRGGTTISCSGTVGGGTPVLLFLRRLHESHGIERVDAALSVTLAYVCSQLAAGVPLADAVRSAQRSGWAEPDPTLDLDGTDAHAKAIIIHNLLFPGRRALALEKPRVRPAGDVELLRRVARSGKPSEVRAVIAPGHVALELADGPWGDVGREPAGGVVARATLRDGSTASIRGPGAGPRTTAAALLGDLRTLAECGNGRGRSILP